MYIWSSKNGEDVVVFYPNIVWIRLIFFIVSEVWIRKSRFKKLQFKKKTILDRNIGIT